jgi:hypothetical protein
MSRVRIAAMLFWLGVCCRLLIAAVPAAQAPGAAGPARTAYDRYRVLAERNIYTREHGARSRTSILRGGPSPVRNPEQEMVLAGVVRRGADAIAFFQDTTTGATTRVRTGDTLVRGRIGRITLDYVEYVKNDGTSRVAIGGSLAGGASADTVPASGLSTAPASPAAPEARLSPVTSDESLLEQMRQRRRREAGTQ